MTKCIIENCDREMQHPKSGLCSPCYSSLWYWKQKSVTDIVKRKKNLRVFAARMDSAEPKVAVIGRRNSK